MGDYVQIIDNSVVEELISLGEDGDPELLLDLIEMFAADAPSKVQAVHDGLANQDLETIERAAHSLKGSSGNLGATKLQIACDRMQTASRNHAIDEVRALVDELTNEFELAMAALRDVQAQYSA